MLRLLVQSLRPFTGETIIGPLKDQTQVTLGHGRKTTESVGQERKAVRKFELAHHNDIALEARRFRRHQEDEL